MSPISSDLLVKDPAGPGMRVAKYLSRCGACSRRDAERIIEEGRVTLNGEVLDSPVVLVSRRDELRIDGIVIPPPEPPRLWKYHKPPGLVTTARDEQGRPTVFDNLPVSLPRVISVGRLDMYSEGLLLLTNDGELARHLELPATGLTRRYRVRVHGPLDEKRLATLERGVTIDGIQYGPIEAKIESLAATNAWLNLSLWEGKNREVRKLMEHVGLTVNRLIRVAYGPFDLGKLDREEVAEVPWKMLQAAIGDTGL